MNSCAHTELLEQGGLQEAGDASGSWLEAHVGECEACARELDRLLELRVLALPLPDERSLFEARARSVETPLDPSDTRALFEEIDRRGNRARNRGRILSLVAAAAACFAVALVSAHASRAHLLAPEASAAGPDDFGAPGATASSDDDALMTHRLAACVIKESARACDAPREMREMRGATRRLDHLDQLTSQREYLAWSTTPAVCEPDVTCSVAGP